MDGAKPSKKSMSTSEKLDKDEKGEATNQKDYRGTIGSLLYLTASWLDIQFSVCLYARFQANISLCWRESLDILKEQWS